MALQRNMCPPKVIGLIVLNHNVLTCTDFAAFMYFFCLSSQPNFTTSANEYDKAFYMICIKATAKSS